MARANQYTPGQIADEVRMLICRKTGLEPEAVRPESRLLHDLGVTGDDAAELIDEFAQTFSVDMSSFQFQCYFTGEPSFSHALWMLGIKDKPIWSGKLPLTVARLIDAASAGHWNEELSHCDG